MVKDILAAIDAEIAILGQAKDLLSGSRGVITKRKPGRPAKDFFVTAPRVQNTRGRRKLSAEARERIRQAQIKRWAAQKGATKANMNGIVAPLRKAKKKATMAA